MHTRMQFASCIRKMYRSTGYSQGEVEGCDHDRALSLPCFNHVRALHVLMLHRFGIKHPHLVFSCELCSNPLLRSVYLTDSIDCGWRATSSSIRRICYHILYQIDDGTELVGGYLATTLDGSIPMTHSTFETKVVFSGYLARKDCWFSPKCHIEG